MARRKQRLQIFSRNAATGKSELLGAEEWKLSKELARKPSFAEKKKTALRLIAQNINKHEESAKAAAPEKRFVWEQKVGRGLAVAQDAGLVVPSSLPWRDLPLASLKKRVDFLQHTESRTIEENFALRSIGSALKSYENNVNKFKIKPSRQNFEQACHSRDNLTSRLSSFMRVSIAELYGRE